MEKAKEGAVPLDGNAAAGLLRELFVLDLTVASLTCEGCGAVARLAEVRVYGGPMGAIFRWGRAIRPSFACPHADRVLARHAGREVPPRADRARLTRSPVGLEG
jgi:hypothetical protein